MPEKKKRIFEANGKNKNIYTKNENNEIIFIFRLVFLFLGFRRSLTHSFTRTCVCFWHTPLHHTKAPLWCWWWLNLFIFRAAFLLSFSRSFVRSFVCVDRVGVLVDQNYYVPKNKVESRLFGHRRNVHYILIFIYCISATISIRITRQVWNEFPLCNAIAGSVRPFRFLCALCAFRYAVMWCATTISTL